MTGDAREALALKALRLHDEYAALPADRGGANGRKGKAQSAWLAAKAAALASSPATTESDLFPVEGIPTCGPLAPMPESEASQEIIDHSGVPGGWGKRVLTEAEGSEPVAMKAGLWDLCGLLRHAFMTGRGVSNKTTRQDVDAWLGYDPTGLPAYQRILTSIEAHPVAVKVEPLDWEPDGVIASTPFGVYSVGPGEEDTEWTWTRSEYPFGHMSEPLPTEAAAKAAAQKDYEQRILSAIEAQPVTAIQNAAYERAAEVAERMFAALPEEFPGDEMAKGKALASERIADAIRALKTEGGER